MKLLFCIVCLLSCVAIYAYFSRVLSNDHVDTITIDERRADFGPGANPGNLFWFAQVSDIHISRYRDYGRAPELKSLCDKHLSVIKPELVIASGDLTDAKFLDLRGSKQFRDEWQKYQDAVQHCQTVVKTWLDLRGNHDAFDTPDFDHESNLFRKYGAQGQKNPSSYIHHIVKPYGKYSFVGVDASPNPGPKRPFNFFGYIKQDGETALKNYLLETRASNMTIAFGHYPTSLISMQSGGSVKDILRNVTAYLCGHLHTFMGMIPKMFARQKTGMLELELGDWKEARLYRVLAIDHDMLSFSDQVAGKWPIVMVTNPKEASLMSPQHEPLWRMISSTHIRILVFSPNPINSVEVHIDEMFLGRAKQSQGPLYVLPWQPKRFKTGLHTIRVTVQESGPGRHTHEQLFSLDGTSPLLPFRARFILMLDIATVLKVTYFFLVIVYIGVLVLLHTCNNIKAHLLTESSWLLRPLFKFYNGWLYRVWLVAQTPRLFYPLVGFMLYISIGPWFIGELMEGHSGVVFVWGMYVYGHYLPMWLTYIYGITQVIVVNIPMTMYLGYLLQYGQLPSNHRTTVFQAARHVYLPLAVLLLLQVYVTFTEFPAAYGTRALVLGPLRTGSLLLTVIWFYIARRTNVAALFKHAC